MFHIILGVVFFICMLLVTIIALSGIKFYTMNSESESPLKDAIKLKVLTITAFAFACVSVCTIIIF